jgi:hypothetical protein
LGHQGGLGRSSKQRSCLNFANLALQLGRQLEPLELLEILELLEFHALLHFLKY